MPAEHMTPGFFGKIPATGDFVSRRLSRDFVRFWDRLAARHLVPLMKENHWPAEIGLRFLSNTDGRKAVTGVVVSSSDRVGRLFPLTAAVSCPNARPDRFTGASDWFGRVEEALIAARNGETDADRLAEILAGLPFPPLPPSKAGGSKGLWLWTDGTPPVEANPEAPQGVLDELLAPVSEAG